MTAGIRKTVLPNGVRIVSLPMAHTRCVSVGVWVNAGARDEADPENGLSHFIEHMIFKGTQKRSAFQIAKEFDAIGGHTNAFTTMEHTCYHAKVLDTQIETMVDILSDIFLNSVFDPREVERERPVHAGLQQLLGGQSAGPLHSGHAGDRIAVQRRDHPRLFPAALPACAHGGGRRRQRGPPAAGRPDRAGL